MKVPDHKLLAAAKAGQTIQEIAESRSRATETLARRFWEKVSPCPITGCWWWMGATYQNGYGVLAMPRERDGKWVPQGAHRMSLVVHGIALTPGLVVDHLCRQPWCVNPTHLRQVTQLENMACNKRSHCIHGHPIDASFFSRKRQRSIRFCRTCHRAKDTKRRARRRNASTR